jgi:hypothetical protein
MFICSYSNFSCSAETAVSGGNRRSFLKSSEKHHAWYTEGAGLLGEFIAGDGEYNSF